MATNLLRVGAKGDSVKSLQQQLNSQGYKLAEDGVFGNQTRSAVMDYQKKNGLAVDGLVGTQTLGSLAKRVAQPAPSPAPQPAQVQQPVEQAQQTQPISNIPYGNDPEVAQFDSFLKQQADSQVQSATAGLDAKLSSDIANLQKAYDNAIAEGNISQRDAEAEFNQQKALLEKQAYQDSQRTTLYGQEMGIQNSQQQQGLMQGDQARNANLVNANVSTRDKRVNDIKDRISAITKQKDLDVANAQSQHDAGVIQAKADATKSYADGMFNVSMQKFNFNNNLKQLQEQSRLQIEQMNVQHGLDLDKMKVDLENSMALEAKKYGYSSALQSQAAKQAQQQAIAKAQAEMQAEQKAYETARSRELAKYTPGTPEYTIKEQQLSDSYKEQISKIHAATVYDATAKAVLSDPALSNKQTSAPTDISKTWGALGNLITGYSGKKAEYDAYQSAVARKNAFIQDPAKYMGY